MEQAVSLANQNIELVMKDGQVVARPPYQEQSGIPEEMMAGAWLCCGLPSPEH